MNAGNLIPGINAWAVSVVRYAGAIVDWTKGELKAMDRKTRKILCMNRKLHPRSNVSRLYLKRRDGGRGLISVEDCVEGERKGLNEYVTASKEEMVMCVKKEGILNEEESRAAFKKRVKLERMEDWKTKSLHGQFFRDTEGIADDRSFDWIRSGFLKAETEGMIFAAQEQALRTRAIRAHIDK